MKQEEGYKEGVREDGNNETESRNQHLSRIHYVPGTVIAAFHV